MPVKKKQDENETKNYGGDGERGRGMFLVEKKTNAQKKSGERGEKFF